MSMTTTTPLTDTELEVIAYSYVRGTIGERAAAEIRALRAVNAELVAALALFANVANDSGLKADVLHGMRLHEIPTMERALADAARLVARAEGRAEG